MREAVQDMGIQRWSGKSTLKGHSLTTPLKYAVISILEALLLFGIPSYTFFRESHERVIRSLLT